MKAPLPSSSGSQSSTFLLAPEWQMYWVFYRQSKVREVGWRRWDGGSAFQPRCVSWELNFYATFGTHFWISSNLEPILTKMTFTSEIPNGSGKVIAHLWLFSIESHPLSYMTVARSTPDIERIFKSNYQNSLVQLSGSVTQGMFVGMGIEGLFGWIWIVRAMSAHVESLHLERDVETGKSEETTRIEEERREAEDWRKRERVGRLCPLDLGTTT